VNKQSIKKLLLGKPIATRHAHHEKISIPVGLAVFASDALSSVAYATEEILLVLVVAGTVLAYNTIGPIAIALCALMIIVAFSYSQTIKAYPKGGGTYLVSTENLGSGAGRVAGAALLIDYVLTVAVSISSGTAAIISIWPQAQNSAVPMALFAIGVLCLMNLRGAKESGLIFSLPTYFFVTCIMILVVTGVIKAFSTPIVTPVLPNNQIQDFSWFLILRGFAASCTALTGTEAIADGVQAFKEPSSVNARRTLAIMVFLLITMFGGITFIAHHFGAVPMHSGTPGYQTVLATITENVFGRGWFFQTILIATASILFLAANTAFADFPRLCSFIAKDGYLPRQLMSIGDRYVYQNGIILLSLAAGALVIIYNADTHSLIPLYALGVFISFTMSQSGMTVKFLKDVKLRKYRRQLEQNAGEKTTEQNYRGLFAQAGISAFGAVVTFCVAIILLITKFTEGAWIIALAIAIMLGVFYVIKRHYNFLAENLNVRPDDTLPEMRTTTLLLVPRVHRGILKAIRYAQMSSQDVRAVHVTLDIDSTERVKADWIKFGADIPLVILESPYRSLTSPIVDYVDEMIKQTPNLYVTVIVPQAVPRKWLQSLLHNNAAIGLKLALQNRRNVVITNVRYFI